MARILVWGPPRARAMLDPIAAALALDGAELRLDEAFPPAPRGDIEILVPLAARCDAEALALLPNLRAIAVPTIGHEWVDLAEASRRGIVVANAPARANYESLAEATMLLILASTYQLPEAQAALRRSGPRSQPAMLGGRRIGLIGFGRVARRLAALLQPWHATVLAYSRRALAVPGIRFMALDALLSQSDVVVLLASLNPSSRHLLDAARLARLRPGAILVNTARGELIEEAALPALVESGHIGYLALDVFAQEPLAPDSPLRRLPRTILTPHALAHTGKARSDAQAMTVANVRRLLAGTLPRSVLNRKAVGPTRE